MSTVHKTQTIYTFPNAERQKLFDKNISVSVIPQGNMTRLTHSPLHKVQMRFWTPSLMGRRRMGDPCMCFALCSVIKKPVIATSYGLHPMVKKFSKNLAATIYQSFNNLFVSASPGGEAELLSCAKSIRTFPACQWFPS